MKISELARLTGVSPRSIRYYEQQNLLVTERRENGYRHFTEESVDEIKAIQFYFNPGLTTHQIRPLLTCSSEHEACDTGLGPSEKKLHQIDGTIARLCQIQRALGN